MSRTKPAPAAPISAMPIPELSPWGSVAALEEWLNGDSKQKTFTQHALRHYVRNAASNGLEEAGAIRYIGTKILIHRGRFAAWLEGCAASKATLRSRGRVAA
ncbi:MULTISPECIES: hypothetical protein [unclassified Thiocapsa]|uniref:hypothetical protein n=1 Tax=unclassified Thiocapsa TaxID=2641286 RepID=UPI0035AFBA9F